MKTIGITCDNYKVEIFKKRLEESFFVNIKVEQFIKDCSIIKIMVHDVDYHQSMRTIYNICKEVQLTYKN
jgi:hypothetical protein